MEEFKDRLRAAMELRRMRPVDLCNETGLKPQQISHYLHGVYKPKPDKVDLICEALNVDPGWMLGYETTAERKEEEEQRVSAYMEKMLSFAVTKHEKEIIDKYRRLDTKTRGIVDFIITGKEEGETI